MKFIGYNTQKLNTPPDDGVNPPTGYIFSWETVSDGVRTTHYRDSSGTDSSFPFADYTNPANIIQTASYRFVSDTEKSTWNGKQDSLGFTPVPNTVTINSKQLNGNISISASDIGLENVTNESKTTMFTDPVFTGKATTPVIRPAVDGTAAVKIS